MKISKEIELSFESLQNFIDAQFIKKYQLHQSSSNSFVFFYNDDNEEEIEEFESFIADLREGGFEWWFVN